MDEGLVEVGDSVKSRETLDQLAVLTAEISERLLDLVQNSVWLTFIHGLVRCRRRSNRGLLIIFGDLDLARFPLCAKHRE